MNRLSIVVLLLCIASGVSCVRLDANLFNPSKVESYNRDNYQGPVDFKLEASYHIDDAYIYPISNEISADDGNAVVDVQALFVGELARIGEEDYTVILYCHGNRDHMDFYWPRTKLLANVGAKNQFGILTLDYHGYGATPGKPSEEGMYADVAATIKWLEDKAKENGRTMESKNFIMYGFSLGTAPAVELTANPRTELVASKLILEAPFASAEVMVQDSTQLALPGVFFTNLKIDNAEEIKKLTNIPLLWIHGDQDSLLDINTHGSVVFKNHPGKEQGDGLRKYSIKVDDAGHSDIPSKLGDVEYKDYELAIYEFIDQG